MDAEQLWTYYPQGLPVCTCGEHGKDRQRAKYHSNSCPRWEFLWNREHPDGQLRFAWQDP